MYPPPSNPFEGRPPERGWRNWSQRTWILILVVAALGFWFFRDRFSSLVMGQGSLLWLAGQFLAPLIVILAAMPVHEAAHAAAAVWLGDETPREQGRLTLNPLRHLDPLGTILLLVVGMGWAKPVIWNPSRINVDIRLGTIVVAVAGPLSNLLMAFIALVLLHEGVFDNVGTGTWTYLTPIVVSAFVQINILLAVFNLIPVPPLDGSHVLFALLPASARNLQFALSQYGILVIMFIVWFAPGLIRDTADVLYDQMNTVARMLA